MARQAEGHDPIPLSLRSKGLASFSGPRELSDHRISVLPLAFQNGCAVLLLELLKAAKLVSFERMSDPRRMALALPLSLSFVAMIVTGYTCLKVPPLVGRSLEWGG